MKKINYCFETEWDYLKHKEIYPSDLGDAQVDWNQTLMTTMNLCSNKIHLELHRGGADSIMVNPKLMGIIKTLEYFDEKTKMIGNRYKVNVFDGLSEDEMIVYQNINKDVFVDNLSGEIRFFLMVDKEKVNENNYIVQLHDREGNNEELYQEFLKSSKCKVKILNHE